MTADAIYMFQQKDDARTRYKLIDHRGADIPDFPAAWKKGPEAGKKYVVFRGTVNNKPGHRQFSHTVELDKGRTVTGVNFAPETPDRTWGDYVADALLIDFSDSGKRITIYFFKDMKEESQSLFHKWVEGELPELAAADFLPLEKKAG